MSVLKWESNDENDYTLAETMQGEYMVCELNGGGWDCMFRDWQLDSKIYETKQAAMDACESDYIARCTEFLRVAGPGECVVKVAHLEIAVNELRDLCGPDCSSVAKLTAAIDAAVGAFTHPAHLHTYDPQAEVKISRATAKTALAMLSGHEDVLSFDRDDAETEFRAALEGKG